MKKLPGLSRLLVTGQRGFEKNSDELAKRRNGTEIE
jgi:hypothetical protein